MRRLVHLGEQVEDRGLAGTVGADETGDLSLADGQAKVIDCLKAVGNDGARRIRDHLALVELKLTGHRLPPPSWKQSGP